MEGRPENRLDARWKREMPMADSTETLPVGSGWLRGMNADGTYTIEQQAGVFVRVSQDDADAGGSNFDQPVTRLPSGCPTARPRWCNSSAHYPQATSVAKHVGSTPRTGASGQSRRSDPAFQLRFDQRTCLAFKSPSDSSS